MNQVRVVAVGLLIAMIIMIFGAQTFFTWWLSSTTMSTWTLGLEALSPAMAKTSGVGLVGVAAFIAGSLGTGVLLSSWLFVLLSGSQSFLAKFLTYVQSK